MLTIEIRRIEKKGYTPRYDITEYVLFVNGTEVFRSKKEREVRAYIARNIENLISRINVQ